MKDRQVTQKILVAGIVSSMFLWGLSWPSGKVLTGYCSAVNFTVYRYIVVVLAMLVLVPALGFSLRIKKAGIPFVLMSGLLLAAYSFFFFMGLKNGAPGAGGVLVTTLNPVMAYTIGIFLSRKLPSRNEAIGLVLGIMAGCVLLRLWGNSTLLEGGNIFFLLAALTWAVMSKLTARGASYGSSLSFSLWQYLVTLCCMLPFTDVPELRAAMHITAPVFWLNLFFSAAIVTALATTVYFYSTTRLGAEKASSFMFLVPLAAALSSWLFLGEQIKLHTMIGGMLGIAAVYFINKRKQLHPDIS